MTYDYKYFPKPQFVHINEDGEITLEWIAQNGDRLLIVLDGSKQLGELDSHTYAIYTAMLPNGQFHQEMMLINGPADVLKAMALLGLRAE